MSDFNPSVCEIQKAEIISYNNTAKRDITSSFISRFEITQSMDAVAYSGWLFVVDTIGILDGLPIRGEETLELWLKGMDLGTEVRISARIHKVSDITPTQSSNGATYKLHFVSKTTFDSTTKRITEAHTDTVSVMAHKMFNAYYAKLGAGNSKKESDDSKFLPFGSSRYPIIEEPKRQFIIQPTYPSTNLIIPRLTPSEAMFFVAARGYNPETPSQTFRFFETLENYYFCTDEYFLKGITAEDVVPMYYAPVVSYDAVNAAGQLNRIETLHVLSKGIDTSTDLFSGSYRNEVVEIDFIRRRLDISKFNYDDAQYIDMTGTTKSISNNPHTEKFRNDTFTENNARRFMIYRNYTRQGDGSPNTLRADEKLAEIVHNRVSYYHHLNNTSVMAGLKGRLDIRPGMIVDLQIKNLDGVSPTIGINQTMSGRYLVQSTVHSRDDEGTLNTMLKMAKFDWSAQAQTNIAESTSFPGST
jgi:hypothetical protein